MTGGENEAQEVVADILVDRGIEIRRALSSTDLDLATQLLMLAFGELAPAKEIESAVLRRGHEPGARVVRDARCRPALKRGEECLLRQLLGQTNVAQDPGQAGDELRRFDPPDRVDRAMRIGGRHGLRLEHSHAPAQDRISVGCRLGQNDR
jgi:hypothetical protein